MEVSVGSFQRRMVIPITSYPWFLRISAATEESTPPLIATITLPLYFDMITDYHRVMYMVNYSFDINCV